MRVKAVQLLVNSQLPPEMRDYHRKLDAGSISDLLAEVASKHPDDYSRIVKGIADIGRNASYYQGETITLDDMRPVLDKGAVLKEMDKAVAAARKDAIDDDDFRRLRNNIWTDYSGKLEKMTGQESLRKGNNLAYSVVSGARGKPQQLQAMLTTPGVYQDSKGEIIPLFVRHSFGEGLRPAEFLASTYGARTSVLATKIATAKGGYLAKLMTQAATPLVVTEKDCGVKNGLDLNPEDPSLRNRVLMQEVDGYPRGTVIDKKVLSKIQASGRDHVIVGSALTCQAKQGVCSRCIGAQANGKLPSIGDSVGITAAQALGEPITQSALNTKHTGGQAKGKKEYSGFNVINRFVQSPETFEDRAVVAESDGIVEKIEVAPQGGSYVYVNGQKHYVAPGYPITAKPGEKVEAGDQLADGLVDPSDIVRLRGLGEARRYYSDRLKKILDDSGMKADSRNTEIMARAAMDHVIINDVDGPAGTLPDDIVSYNRILGQYEPPEDTVEDAPESHLNNYLQAPALHYSIGTRITPKIAKHLSSRGFASVRASPTMPPFSPEMVRLQTSTHHDPDWLASQNTSYLKGQLQDKATRGTDTNIESNVHYIPRLAIGKGFGDKVRESGRF